MNGCHLIIHSTYLCFIQKNLFVCLCACAFWVCACVHVGVHTLVWAHTREARGWLSSSIKKTRLSLNLDLTSQLWDPGDVPAYALIVLGL